MIFLWFLLYECMIRMFMMASHRKTQLYLVQTVQGRSWLLGCDECGGNSGQEMLSCSSNTFPWTMPCSPPWCLFPRLVSWATIHPWPFTERGWDDPGEGQLWEWDEVDTLISEWPQQKPPSPTPRPGWSIHVGKPCALVRECKDPRQAWHLWGHLTIPTFLLLKTAMIRPVWHGVLFMLRLLFLAA